MHEIVSALTKTQHLNETHRLHPIDVIILVIAVVQRAPQYKINKLLLDKFNSIYDKSLMAGKGPPHQ